MLARLDVFFVVRSPRNKHLNPPCSVWLLQNLIGDEDGILLKRLRRGQLDSSLLDPVIIILLAVRSDLPVVNSEWCEKHPILPWELRVVARYWYFFHLSRCGAEDWFCEALAGQCVVAQYSVKWALTSALWALVVIEPQSVCSTAGISGAAFPAGSPSFQQFRFQVPGDCRR
ncbi:hypothetical protein NDU88_003025 [Pleurodeles waltl]|uniref:Uncharacterized protein n=1 Tax=Pleurodeles waltl TaxID=8319 RepID=A0AAV7QEK9_PLEWA|nr:hypothetical protein NDU88_003025 [Pleurodeles waltl]